MKEVFLVVVSLVFLVSCKVRNNVVEKVFKTSTGKSISVSETHPVGKSLSKVVVKTIDFENNSEYTLTDIDPVVEIKIADIDNNGFDEIYLITQGAGSGSYANIIGYASNKDKSMTPINVHEISGDDELFKGYMGHDTFTFHKNKIDREFPIYSDDDSNAKPKEGTGIVSYLLKQGEASWQLEIDRTFSEMVQLIRDCTGTYIQLGGDYKVCNPEFFEGIDSDTMVNIIFKKVDGCPAEEGVAVCMMYHESADFVEVTSFNY